jgi:MtN3 and saliva related transmembrane protein
MDRVDAIGMVAGSLTTIAFVPQVLKTWRTQSARDFSLNMLILFTTGVLLWLAYGLLLMQMPIVLPNAVTLVLSAYILVVKLREAT